MADCSPDAVLPAYCHQPQILPCSSETELRYNQVTTPNLCLERVKEKNSYLRMVTDVNKTYCGDHYGVYIRIKSLRYIPEINIVL